jgi:hypothetical protein
MRINKPVPEGEGFDRIGQAFCGSRWAIYNIDLRSIGRESWNIQKVDYCG